MWSLPSEEMIQKKGSEDKKQLIVRGVMKRASQAETQHVQRPRGGDLIFEDVKEQCGWNTVTQGVSGRRKR